jgi:outer membrane protein assembly factor BamB
MKTTLLLFSLAASALAQGTGYRGDGTCVFPKASPPITADEKTGQNILWKVPLPNWGHAFPVEMAGRVFVISEGGWPATQDLPVLQCLDAVTGKELWRKDLNHLPATSLSPADQQAALKAWHDVLADFRTNYTIFNEFSYAADEAGKEAARAKFKALGRDYAGWSGGGYGQLRKLKPKCDEAKAKIAAKAGLTLATWQHGCGMGQSCFGQTFPTPVTDGTHLYVVTAFGGFFCFDKDGNQVWVKHYPGKVGEYCRNGRSPLIYKDLLISDVTSLARAIDLKTGALKWSQPVDDETMMTPVIITCGQTDVLLCFNKKAFRLPDGAPLTIEGGSDFGATALVKSDERDVVFFTGGGEHGGWTNKGKTEVPPPACVKFKLDGDKLTGTVLWAGIDGQGSSGHTGLLYHDGKLYRGGVALDAKTGKVALGSADRRSGQRAAPNTRHLLQLAGKHLYGLTETGKSGEGKPAQQATLEVYDLDGKKVGESVFANAPVTGAKQQQIIEQNGWNTWMFSYSCPFTVAGNRIYIRSYDYLWCLGSK